MSELIKDASLEDQLIYLCKYGRPRLSRMDGGWHARIDMHVATEGTSFEVKSDFNHITPSQAIELLHNRILATLQKLDNLRIA